MPFDPDKWMTSLFRSLRAYIEDTLVEDQVYELVFSYPDVTELAKKMPFPLTIIHFEIDNPRQVFFGIGENIVDAEYDDLNFEVEEWEAHCHEVDWNVGVWASVESGGVSSRLEARQDLDSLFNGPAAREACMVHTDGVEVLSFTGGQFITDSINDMVVFRIIDMALRTRVYSRTKKVPKTYIDDIEQQPELVIDGEVTIEFP